jgi:DUF1680 family protein
MRDDPLRPVPASAVRIEDAFWGPRLETNRTRTIPALFRNAEETGRLDNFRIAAARKTGRFRGRRYDDSDVFKAMEAAACSLACHPDARLAELLEGVVSDVAAAQEADGYLYTARSIDPTDLPPGSGPERWSFLEQSHELYNAGHLYEAAVAHFQATGRRRLLDVALSNASLVLATFGPAPSQHPGVPGHEEIEIALVKLYRTTGDERYLRQARYFLDERGNAARRSLYAYDGDLTYAQDHAPVVEQAEAVGHAVRALYLYAALADVAALGGDPRHRAALERLWQDVVGRKTYVTGGLGASARNEAFGPAYELPNATAYSETCASVASVFWNQRMFLLTGEARYLDVLERTLYNALLAGVELSGERFFYDNPLASSGEHERRAWFDCACCPPNVARLLASLGGYVYAAGQRDLYVNLLVGSQATLDLAGTRVAVRLRTDYPWSGRASLRLEPETDASFRLRLRVPGWALGHPVPSDLYTFADVHDEPPSLRLNGAPIPVAVEKGFATLDRRWAKGDSVELDLPMPVRRLASHPAVVENAGCVALQRGPLVYAAEAVDNGGSPQRPALPDTARFETQHRAELLGGLTTVTARGAGTALVTVPYHAWNHRGRGEMVVWLPRGGA